MAHHRHRMDIREHSTVTWHQQNYIAYLWISILFHHVTQQKSTRIEQNFRFYDKYSIAFLTNSSMVVLQETVAPHVNALNDFFKKELLG